MNSSTSVVCANCKAAWEPNAVKCPFCGGSSKAYSVVVKETLHLDDGNLRIRQRSGAKDARGKCIQETNIKVRGNTQTIITVDRSKRLIGNQETDVYHKVIKNGKTIHGPHLEPKKRKTKKSSKVKE